MHEIKPNCCNEGKLDKMLEPLNTLTTNMNSFNKKFTRFEEKASSNETRIELKNEQKGLKLAITDLQTQKDDSQHVNAESLNDLQKQIEQIKAENYQRILESKNDQLCKDRYSKQFNYLIHRLSEDKEKVWETRDEAETIYRNFLAVGLELERNSIETTDLHRLSQHPIFDRTNQKINRPIVVNFSNIFGKRIFIQNLKNLKKFNEKRH